MSIAGLCKRFTVLLTGFFYGAIVAVKLLLKTFKLGPRTVFAHKTRNKPPACLQQPDLGTHGYAHLEDIRMHYVSNGAEDKPLMLLVHGFPEFWYSWRYQLREFKDQYRVVAVDLRGYGDSDKPSGIGNYTTPKLVNDLKQMVNALGYHKCVMAGHDWGGALAWAFADKFPDMISHLIILNCPNEQALNRHMEKSFQQFKMSWYIFFFQLPWLPELLLRFNDFAILSTMMRGKSGGVRSDCMTEEDMEAYKYTFSKNGVTEPINFYRAALSLSSLSRDKPPKRFSESVNRGITMPTLIIWGEEDMALEKALVSLSMEVCKGKVTVRYIQGASHWVQMDRPDLVNSYMREFLAEN
ncbi:hypothetical protein ACOMHN_019609 [Nucella lapillus]